MPILISGSPLIYHVNENFNHAKLMEALANVPHGGYFHANTDGTDSCNAPSPLSD